MPLGAANRIAKSYVENIFIWNAWPILYGGFGALLSAVQMGQIGQMLGQNNFLGGLGNLEGSILIGIVSIVYSLAIAVIPFIAKRIISGDVGSTAVAMVGTAVTARRVWRQREPGLPVQPQQEPLPVRPARDLRARSRPLQAETCPRHRSRHPSRLPLPQRGFRLATAILRWRAMPTRFVIQSVT
jgi:hypothetical protein